MVKRKLFENKFETAKGESGKEFYTAQKPIPCHTEQIFLFRYEVKNKYLLQIIVAILIFYV